MRRHASIGPIMPPLLGLAIIVALPATAQETVPEAADAAQQAASPAEPEKKKKRDLLIAPVPLSSPATGTGLALGGVAFYNPNHEPQQWVTGGGIVYTDNGTKGLGGFHSMSFGQDRFRIKLVASYIDANSDYYGIGAADGDRGESLDLSNKQLSIQLQGLMRIFRHGFAGVRYKLTTNDATPDVDADAPPSPVVPPPPDALTATQSVIGPVFAYDSRDSATQPRRGIYASATWLIGIKALGDSYAHDKLQLSSNIYFPFGPKTVLATRASVCSAGGDVPYYDLCLFGSGADLRGYAGGRYRDRASWAVQGELRQTFTRRWGGVAFFGLGGIAPSASGILTDSNLLPSAGVGVRYRPFKDNDVQLRLDVAKGKNDHGVYFSISESF